MSAASDYLETEFLDHIFRSHTFTQPGTIAICLLTTAAVDGDTGEFSLGTGVEVSETDTGYARQVLNPDDSNWSDPDGVGYVSNSSAITFPTATDDWGTIVAVAITDDSDYDSGNLLFHGELTTPKTISAGDTFTFNIGSLQVALD